MLNQSDMMPPQLGSTYSMETAGSASSLGFDSFTTMSLGPNICAHMSPMEASLPAKEAENSEVTISIFVVMTNFIIFMTLPDFLLLL